MTDELKIISRKEAIARKLRKYFTGKPCNKAQHISERYVHNWVCVECHRIYLKGYRQQNKDKARETLKAWRIINDDCRKKLPPALPPTLRKRKPKEWRWVAYSYCKSVVNDLNIKTVAAYHAWVKHYKPAGIPSDPPEAYSEEWTGWSDFLEARIRKPNEFKLSKQSSDLLSYEDAVKIVHTLGIKSEPAYIEAFNASKLPAGLPKRPDNAYGDTFKKNDNWVGYLGKSISSKLRVNKEKKSFLVLYNAPDTSNNILSIFIYRDGLDNMKKTIIDKQIPVVKIYNWYDDYADEIFKILNEYGTKQTDVSWMFYNTYEILAELSTVLEIVNA